jgi:membrane protease YdiL (CAAX protease family)
MSFWDNKICKKIGKQKFLIFVLILFVLINIAVIFLAFALAILNDLFGLAIPPHNVNVEDKVNLILKIISSCILAPIIETLLCQNCLISLLNRFSSNKTFQVLTASAIFGLLHFSNVFFIVHAFLGGLVFNFGFIIYKENKGLMKATYAIIIVHFLRNCMAFISIISKL